jgi:hypothetical protein
MKIKLSLLALFIAGCSGSSPIETQHITVDPQKLVFEKGVDSLSISITHNCTCPFHWTAIPDSIISMQSSGSADDPQVWVVLKRDKLVKDKDSTWSVLPIQSNYGDATVSILALQ